MKKIQICFCVILLLFMSWQAAPAKEKMTAQDWYQKGVALDEQNVYGEAIKMYTEAIELDEEYADAYFKRAKSMLAMNPSETFEPMQDFNKVIDLDPKNAEAYYERGLLHNYILDIELAMTDMETAASLGHEGARNWLNNKKEEVAEEVEKEAAAMEVEEPEYINLANYLPSKSDPIVHFDFNRADIKSAYYPLLDQIGVVLKETLPDVRVIVAGYTDGTGTEKYNQGLSERRAAAVSTYLSGTHGITSERIIVKAYGETGPIASNGTEEGRAKNRRAEMLGIREP